MNVTIRKAYLYLTSLIGLVLILIGGVQLVNLGLKTFIFTKADDQSFYACQRPAMVEGDKSVAPAFDEELCRKQQADERSSRRQSQASNAIAMILVGAPVWFYHWRKVKDERDV